jgi:hypothetical protein
VLDTDQSDPWAGHSPVDTNNPQNWYCQAPGWYLGYGYVPYQYTGGSAYVFGMGLGVSLGGTLSTYAGQAHLVSSGEPPGVFGADLFQLATAGTISSSADYVQLQAYTTDPSGPLLAASSPNNPRLSVRWAGTGSASSLAVPSNAAFPVPPGYVTEEWLLANVTQALEFLENPPMLRYSVTEGELNSATWPDATTVGLDVKAVDNYGAWTGSEYPAPQPGEYFIYGQAGIQASAIEGAAYAAGITINGTTTWGQAVLAPEAASDLVVIVGACGKFRLAEGDTVSLAAFQGSGGGLSLSGADEATRLVIIWDSS